MLLTLLLVIFSSVHANAQTLYDRPVLIVDPDMHTAASKVAAADAAGRFLVTGSDDKTVRIWQAADGKLLQTIRMPAGPGPIGEICAVAMSPVGDIVAAGGYPDTTDTGAIYLFDRSTGRMTKRIGDLPPSVVMALAFSGDGRYLAAALGSGGLRVFDHDKNWSEAYRDEDYEIGVAFANDGRLATSSYDRNIRLYDRNLTLVATQAAPSGDHPARLAFSPDGKVLAVGHNILKPSVDLLDGQSLAPLPGPNLEGLLDNEELFSVAWSADGQTLFASGRYRDQAGDRPVLAWDKAGRGPRPAISAKCAASDSTTFALVPLPEGQLFVTKFMPCFAMLKPDGGTLWTLSPPVGDFRNGRPGSGAKAYPGVFP
jgi:WD40 repeat protein